MCGPAPKRFRGEIEGVGEVTVHLYREPPSLHFFVDGIGVVLESDEAKEAAAHMLEGNPRELLEALADELQDRLTKVRALRSYMCDVRPIRHPLF